MFITVVLASAAIDIIDSKYTDRVEVVFPFTGTHEFTYNVTTPFMPNALNWDQIPDGDDDDLEAYNYYVQGRYLWKYLKK